jgi:hypothetical protein
VEALHCLGLDAAVSPSTLSPESSAKRFSILLDSLTLSLPLLQDSDWSFLDSLGLSSFSPSPSRPAPMADGRTVSRRRRALVSTLADSPPPTASMLAMEIIGILLLITFTLVSSPEAIRMPSRRKLTRAPSHACLQYEFYWAKFPLMPKRVMNRTFLCCIAIDFLYYLSVSQVVSMLGADSSSFFRLFLPVGLHSINVL